MNCMTEFACFVSDSRECQTACLHTFVCFVQPGMTLGFSMLLMPKGTVSSFLAHLYIVNGQNLMDAKRCGLFFPFTFVCSEWATRAASLSPEDFWPALSGPVARGHELSCGFARHGSPCSTAGLSCKLCMRGLAHALLSHLPTPLAPPLDTPSARCSMSMVASHYIVYSIC